jgi:hypothetical protein
MGDFIGSIFGGGDTPAPPAPPPPPPTIDSGEVSAAAAEERKRRSLAEGRASTMLTAESNIEDEAAPTARKKLLGS